MNPQKTASEQAQRDEIDIQQEYVRQVEDHSLPAQEVLEDQQERRAPTEAPVLFVP